MPMPGKGAGRRTGVEVMGGLCRCYLDEALELSVLLQKPGLLLLQGEDVFRRLLENGCLRVGGTSQGPQLAASTEAHFLLPPPPPRNPSSPRPPC